MKRSESREKRNDEKRKSRKKECQGYTLNKLSNKLEKSQEEDTRKDGKRKRNKKTKY